MKQNHSSIMAFGLFSAGSAPIAEQQQCSVLPHSLGSGQQVPIWPVVLQRCLFWHVNKFNQPAFFSWTNLLGRYFLLGVLYNYFMCIHILCMLACTCKYHVAI